MFKKVISLFLSLSLIITQPIFAQGVAQLNLAQYLGQMHHSATDSFRPTQLRYFSYDNLNNSFRILLDKGDTKDIKDNQLKQEAKELMDYFLVGVTLPNDVFWVNLRPDSPENIIDPELEKTGLGKILLEADLQLKKDTASFTSPQTPEGKAYWDKLYKKAGELFGSENITIPTITRPWIVPGEIIVRESGNSAYIYKATLKIMLEEDYLTSRGGSRTAPTPDQYTFSDPRLKELNQYSTQLIKEAIIPKLTKEVNSAKRYAKLRQVYYSLVLSRWFKQKYSNLRSIRAPEHQSSSMDYISLIDSGNLTNLTAKEPYDKLTYFKQYHGSFAKGEYNLKEPVYTPYGQSIRSYMSGGLGLGNEITKAISGANARVVGSPVEQQLLNKENVVVLDNNFKIVNLEQPKALAASPIELLSLKRAVNLFTLKLIEIASEEGNVQGSPDDVAKVRDDLEKLAEDTRKAFDNFRDGDSSLDLLDKLEAAKKRLGDGAEIFISDLNGSADQEAYKKGGIFGQYVDFLKEFKGIEISKYQEILEEIVDGLGNDYDLAAELIRYVRESLDDYKVEIASGEYAQSQLSEKEFLMKRIAVVSEKMSSEDVITEEAKLLVNAWKQHQPSAASPLTVGMVKSTIKTNMDAFNKKYGKNWDKELKELYDGFDPISTYEELTEWIDKAKDFVKIAQKRIGILDAHSGMIVFLENIKKEISRQEKPYSAASPLGKKLPVTDRYGRPLRYVYYWKLSDGEKNSLLEVFRKSFTEWGIKPANKNLRFAVRVNRENKIVAVVGALQYNIYTKEVGIRIVLKGVDKASEIESSLKETYIEEIRLGARFWDNTFSSTAGSSPLGEFVTGGVNSNKSIDDSNEIGGTRIDVIEYRGRPEVYGSISKSGFKEILKKDNTFVLGEKLSHQRLADPLLKVLVASKDGNESFEYNNQKFTIKIIYERAWSIFNDKKRGTNLRYIVTNTIATNTIARKTISFSGLLPYYINDYGFYGGDEAFRLEPKDIIDFFGITASSGLTSESQPSVPFGGIDFTDQAMRIGLEPMGSFADLKLVLPEVSNAAAIDLDNEFKQIQLMASSGIRPSDERILEFAAACYYRGEFGPRLGEITSCLQQAHFLDERLGRESSEALRLATILPEVM